MPDGPIDCNEVLKLRPAEPIRTSRENTCGIQAYLFRYELECCTSVSFVLDEPFECMENSDAKGRNQTDAQSANGTTNSNSQTCAINSRKHWRVLVSISADSQKLIDRTYLGLKQGTRN